MMPIVYLTLSCCIYVPTSGATDGNKLFFFLDLFVYWKQFTYVHTFFLSKLNKLNSMSKINPNPFSSYCHLDQSLQNCCIRSRLEVMLQEWRSHQQLNISKTALALVWSGLNDGQPLFFFRFKTRGFISNVQWIRVNHYIPVLISAEWAEKHRNQTILKKKKQYKTKNEKKENRTPTTQASLSTGKPKWSSTSWPEMKSLFYMWRTLIPSQAGWWWSRGPPGYTMSP